MNHGVFKQLVSGDSFVELFIGPKEIMDSIDFTRPGRPGRC
jgi:hypothetical protein